MQFFKDLFYEIKKCFINLFGGIAIYPYPMFIIFYGSVHYKFKGENQRQVLDILEPGDILVRTYGGYLSTWFIPGYWSHAGIYVGDNRIIHVGGEGIMNEDILTFMRCDDVAVLRVTDPVEGRISTAIERAMKLMEMNIDYDYNFDKNDPESMYCTELVDYCYGGLNYAKKNKILYPDDLMKSECAIVYPGIKFK